MERRPKKQPAIERNIDEARNLVIQAGHKAFEIFVQRDGGEVPIKVEKEEP